MTRGASQNPKTFREQIGPAVWLLALLAYFTPADWNGDASVYVAGGNVVTDAELAERLKVSQGTIARWRRRLRAAGVLVWLVAPGKGRAYWIADVNRVLGVHGAAKTVEQKPTTSEDATALRTEAITLAALKWIQ
jgi:transcriptional regulator with XRE-family HTH domain